MSFFKTIFSKFSFSKEVFVRFPLSYLFIFLSLFFVLSSLQKYYYFSKEFDENLILIFTLSIISISSLKLFFEIKNYNFFIKSFLIVSIIFLTILSVFFFKDAVLFFLLALILSLSFSGFLFKKSSNKEFLSFLFQGIYAVSFAFIASFLLGLGIFIIFTSIEYLFEISFLNQYYEEIYSIIALAVFPTFVLSNITKEESSYFNKPFSNLINNVLVPMFFIYTFILYGYFIKILFLQELPKGNLTWMITIFLSTGLFLKFLLAKIENKNFLSIFYDKYYFYLTLIPLGFLFLAIYIRVLEYGLTISRYAILAFFVWLSFVSIANLFKKDFNYKYIFISLSLILLFSSISPYNASSLSINSQLKRLKTILVDNEILIENKIIPLKTQLETKKRAQISSIVSYLFYSVNGKKELEKFLNKEFKTRNEVLKYLNVDYTKFYDKNGAISYKNSTQNTALDIQDYNYLLTIDIASYNKKRIFNYYENKKKKMLKISLKNSILALNFNDEEKLAFNLKNYLKNLSKHSNIISIDEKNINDSILEKSTKKVKIKLKIDDLGVRVNKSKAEIKINHINFVLLFSIKNK